MGLSSLALGACLACSLPVPAQDLRSPALNTRSFDAAIEDLRSNLNNKSIAAEDIPGPAADVFNRLVPEAAGNSLGAGISWELRVTEGLLGNAFSLPDGGIYVDKEMVQVLGNDPGLWAAVLAHEIVHVTKRHWSKRAALQNSLKDSHESFGFTRIGVFPSRLTTAAPADRERELAAFSQDLELEADLASLGLMARSGFHPDFVTALYHLMEAREGTGSGARFLASHPGWDVREASLHKRYAAALEQFQRFWPEASVSPGGSPPMLAFAGAPQARIDAARAAAEITLPLSCQNATGPVDVILLLRGLRAAELSESQRTAKMRQTIDCTSDKTAARFVVPALRPQDEADGEFYVMDGRGWVLARSSKICIRY
jgi:Zn-dependent protease with chaperone function